MSSSYVVTIEPRARREMDKVPAGDFKKIDKSVRALAGNPRPVGVKKLDENLHRIRIGDWRVIYAIFDKEAKVVILRVVRRNERTYKELN